MTPCYYGTRNLNSFCVRNIELQINKNCVKILGEGEFGI